MNYIREINAFYDWLETNSIPDSAIVLWHALMHINNKTGWVTEFTVAISTLSTKTGLKKDAIIRARLRLQQCGRIDFKSRTGQQSAIYQMISFESEKTTQSATQNNSVVLNDSMCDTNRNTNRAQTASQTENKPRPLLNNTKLNETETEEKGQQQETAPQSSRTEPDYSYGKLYKIFSEFFASEPSKLAFETEFFNDAFDTFGGEWTYLAMREAAKHKKYNFPYVESIMNGFRERGGPHAKDGNKRKSSEVNTPESVQEEQTVTTELIEHDAELEALLAQMRSGGEDSEFRN